MPDVPTTSSSSHASTASTARRHGSSGNSSPNHTTPGRTGAPHSAHGGGCRCVTSSSGGSGTCAGSAQPLHRGAKRLPCRCAATVLPARSCRSSTFCVMTATLATRAQSASARCPAFGSTERTRRARHWYHAHTSAGSAAHACGVASDSASNRSQSPVCASRNVGTPLSADIPAPVDTTIRCALRTSPRLRRELLRSCNLTFWDLAPTLPLVV